jgi:hypothetical protein
MTGAPGGSPLFNWENIVKVIARSSPHRQTSQLILSESMIWAAGNASPLSSRRGSKIWIRVITGHLVRGGCRITRGSGYSAH